MPVLKNIGTLYQCADCGAQADVYPIESAALAWNTEGTIIWVGKEIELPKELTDEPTYDAKQRVVIPGLIDCHTHLAFGGERSEEFEMRVLGKSYLDIAKAGGGILSTVASTRKASEDELTERARITLQAMSALGVTTVECKSGYGLTFEDELKILSVYRTLQNTQKLTIIPTFLGAHTIPREHKENRAHYVDLLINEMIPAVAKQQLATFCDVFVEDSAFSLEEAHAILEAGKRHGLRPKLHADQLSDGGGATLAAELGAISADHLEQISDAGIANMAAQGVIAVTLPIASLYTQETPLNARKLIQAKIPVAVATDYNPGSAPSYHLPLALMLACNLNRMSPAEALKGATIYAARALGVDESLGSLERGKKADFTILDTLSVNHWLYQFQSNNCTATIKGGELLYGAI
jgi:imidazolonepropionase